MNTPEGQGCAVVPAKAREESDTGGGCNTNPAGTDDQRASRPVSPPTTERYCCAVAPDTRRRDAIGATCQLPWGHEGIHQCVGKTGGQTWPKPTPPPERCRGLGRYGRHKWYLRQPGCYVCRACGALDYSTKTTPPPAGVERERFEEWYRTRFNEQACIGLDDGTDAGYHDYEIEDTWAAWQAALSSQPPACGGAE